MTPLEVFNLNENKKKKTLMLLQSYQHFFFVKTFHLQVQKTLY